MSNKNSKKLFNLSRRSFIEALGLKTPYKDADLEARVDKESNTFKYIFALKDGGIAFDNMRRLVIFDAIPATLKSKRSGNIKTGISAAFMYLTYLAYVGNPLVIATAAASSKETFYSLAFLASYFTLSRFL